MALGGYDPTLPLDFDGSSNMMELLEVTLDGESSHTELGATTTTSQTMSSGSGLLLPNLLDISNSGPKVPVRGRTMKENDQQITELKKENLSLKLRIYFLEERMQQKYGDGEDVFKTDIELKVSVQSLKKELQDDQELLRKACQAIETLLSNQESNIDTMKLLEEQHHKYTEELRSDLQKALQVQLLEKRLVAMEGTVRCYSQRLRHYRSLLQAMQREEGGLDARWQSESCLVREPRLSLSFSCSDLREMGHSVVISPDNVQTVGRQPGVGQDCTNAKVQGQQPLSTSSPWNNSDAPAPAPSSLSPLDTTLSMTLMGREDDLTYSSFSESILPLGHGQGHRHNSAWSLPPEDDPHRLQPGRANRRGKLPGRGEVQGSAGVNRGGQSAENAAEGGRSGSSGDEATFDDNGTLHSGLPSDQEEEGGSLGQETTWLKTHVMVLTDMNQTLKEELHVYDSLCRSLGVQVSMDGSTGETSGDDSSCDVEMKLLQCHLAELQRFRAQLEKLDTNAHNAVQMTSLLNSQHIQRIAELEAALQDLREQREALILTHQTTFTQHERTISETRAVRERQERENQLLRENLAALQECEAQRSQLREAEVGELQGQLKKCKDRARDSEYEVQASQCVLGEMREAMEVMKREAEEHSAKLKKRDAQLKKLVEEYKKVVGSQKETNQLNQTLKTEITLYESMTSETVSPDKKEELMQQLLSELSQTRRLAEDLISRLEHCKRNDSPAFTAGPEAADGRPSPEPRDSAHAFLTKSHMCCVSTQTVTAPPPTAKSVEHSTLRELQMLAQNLRVEEEFCDPKLADKTSISSNTS